MKLRHTFAAAAVAAGLGLVLGPALAEAPSGPSPGMGTGHSMMSHGMMPGGMMGHGMMSQGDITAGCSGMMQSMMGGGGRPNSQWQMQPHEDGPESR